MGPQITSLIICDIRFYSNQIWGSGSSRDLDKVNLTVKKKGKDLFFLSVDWRNNGSILSHQLAFVLTSFENVLHLFYNSKFTTFVRSIKVDSKIYEQKNYYKLYFMSFSVNSCIFTIF